MNPITPFNNWVITKIQYFLNRKEGFHIVHEPSYTTEGTRVVVQDAFGYQYEITVRMTGRIINDDKQEYVG